MLAAVAAAAFCGTLVMAYELALARVPEHRAALERLVRAHTGLDVRFNELGLRWGWYGPEAVFRSVELGEPGGSNVLLRAPQLVVGFDAWRTLQTGQLQAGRITLVAPDIDLERTAGTRNRAAGGAAFGDSRAQLLEGWRDGHIEIQGGTLRLADPGGSANSLTLQIRRASLRRSSDQWSAYGLVFLPERLGRNARLAVQLQGDLTRPATLTGALRFDGVRLAFAGWRDLLAAAPALARELPTAGGGDVSVRLNFTKGRIEKADGEVHADAIALAVPPWGQESGAATSGSGLQLGYLGAQWRVARRSGGWQVQVEKLALSREERDEPLSTLSLDIGVQDDHVRGKLARAPLHSVFAVAAWLEPRFDASAAPLTGTMYDIDFDWSAARPAGQRLEASARIEGAGISSPSLSFTLTGLDARVAGSESRLSVDLRAKDAQLHMARVPELDALSIASHLEVSRAAQGWQLSTSRLLIEHDAAQLVLDGTLSSGSEGHSPYLDVRGSVARVAVPLLQRMLGPALTDTFGSAVAQLTTGSIEEGRFELQGAVQTLGTVPWASPSLAGEDQPVNAGAPLFRGSLTLRDATLAASDPWPQTDALTGHLEWNGARVRSVIETAHVGALQVDSLEAQWNAASDRPARVTGQAHGRLEDVLDWVRTHPQLQAHVPHLQDIAARGDGVFSFDVSIPAAARDAGSASLQPARARIAVLLEAAQVQLAPNLPPVESVRGSMEFDAGRLQRSTLTAAWLGGPITLRVSERRERGSTALVVQAQGLLDAQKLVGLARVQGLADVTGQTPWTGELSYLLHDDARAARWQAHVDASLVGIASKLPEPLAKAAGTTVPLHVEISGSDDVSQVRANLGERVRTAFALRQHTGGDWRIERGAVRFGAGPVSLPAETLVLVQGRLGRLDLPAYLLAWEPLRTATANPGVHAELLADELSIAGRIYRDARLRIQRTELGSELRIESRSLDGLVRWPAGGAHSEPIEIRFTRLDVPEAEASDDVERGAMPRPDTSRVALSGALAALGRQARVSIEELRWHGRPMGRLTAMLDSAPHTVALREVRLEADNQSGDASIRCEADLERCRAKFELLSGDSGATLALFGFRPDLSAAHGSFGGELEWQPGSGRPLLQTLTGLLSLRLAEGVVHAPADSSLRPFGLLAVPALLSGIAHPTGTRDGEARAPEAGELRFTRLEAEFQLRDGQAYTSNLHFDGDAEILLRGRTGLLARDYDQVAWVLRGEERIPAPVRRFGATPRVAAAWMSLRELFRGDLGDRSRIVLHLRGSWTEPVVTVD